MCALEQDNREKKTGKQWQLLNTWKFVLSMQYISHFWNCAQKLSYIVIVIIESEHKIHK